MPLITTRYQNTSYNFFLPRKKALTEKFNGSLDLIFERERLAHTDAHSALKLKLRKIFLTTLA